MPIPVYLPKFDPLHERSEILKWLVVEGDSVQSGDPLCEVETDKVVMEVEAPVDGILAGIRYQVGQVAPVAQIIAYLLQANETPADLPADDALPMLPPTLESAPGDAPRKQSVSPVAKRIAEEKQVALDAVQGSGLGGRILRRDIEAYTASTSNGKVRATPAARRLAREADIRLDGIAGSGPRGRIQEADLYPLLDQYGMAAVSPDQSVPLSGMRQRIAARMQQSYQTAPHIYVEMTVDMTAVEMLRRDIKAQGNALSVTSVLVKACAWTLQRHPRLNATFVDDLLTMWSSVNIGIAVALEDGLIVPVLRDAASLSLGEIQMQSADLITRAREGRLSPGDIADGTFTLSNLGMFGVSRFTAILNPPQVAILAVGAIQRQFVPDEAGKPVVRPLMNTVMSVDHRVADGADAARYLADFKHALENPTLMLW